MNRKIMIVFEAGKAFFLRGRDNLAVADEARGRVMIERRDPENCSHVMIALKDTCAVSESAARALVRSVPGAVATGSGYLNNRDCSVQTRSLPLPVLTSILVMEPDC
jgi:hypothetical protein